MNADAKTDFAELGIVCLCCGNRGEADGQWSLNGSSPFRIVEDVPRSWPLTGPLIRGGHRVVVVDAARDYLQWEVAGNPRLECVECLQQFELPVDLFVCFE